MTPTLLRKNRCCFTLIVATEDELLRANGFVPTGHTGPLGDPEYRSPEGFTCSRSTALVIVAEATLGEPEASEGLRGSRAEHRGDDHQEHRGHEDEPVHGLSIGGAAPTRECVR